MITDRDVYHIPVFLCILYQNLPILGGKMCVGQLKRRVPYQYCSANLRLTDSFHLSLGAARDEEHMLCARTV